MRMSRGCFPRAGKISFTHSPFRSNWTAPGPHPRACTHLCHSCEIAQAQSPHQPPRRTMQKMLILTGLLSTALMLLPAHSLPPRLQPLFAACSDGVCLSSHGFALVKDVGMTTQSQNNSVDLQNMYHIQQQDNKLFCFTNMSLMKTHHLHKLCVLCTLMCLSAGSQQPENWMLTLMWL